MNRLRSESIKQILCVLDNFWHQNRNGQSIQYAYREAVNFTAKKYLVRYQTIGDLCRRRLGLTTIYDFHAYLKQWVDGDVSPLKDLLFDHATTRDRQRIKELFHSNHGNPNDSTASQGESPDEQVNIELSSAVIKHLRKLADLQNKSLSDYSAGIVSQHVLQLLASNLKDDLKGLNPGEREKLLRELER